MNDLNAAIRERLAIDDDSRHGSYYFVYDSEMIRGAVFAVLELHRPEPNPSGPAGAVCAHCVEGGPGYEAEATPWPCPTVLAIAKGLGIKT